MVMVWMGGWVGEWVSVDHGGRLVITEKTQQQSESIRLLETKTLLQVQTIDRF